MTPLLITDSKILTSLPPLCAMRQNPTTSRAELREDMSQFMTDRAIDFGWVIEQTRV
jgi:hypothetical protein